MITHDQDLYVVLYKDNTTPEDTRVIGVASSMVKAREMITKECEAEYDPSQPLRHKSDKDYYNVFQRRIDI